MQKLEFKNVTVLYNEEDINKKICKSKSRWMNIWSAITVLMIFVIMFIVIWIAHNLPDVLLILISLILMIGLMFGSIFLGYWIIYRNTIKAFSFMEWLFRMKEVNAGWYNDKILLRVQHSNGIDDYSLQSFLRTIKNKLIITDKSDKNKPIHIFIDIRSNEKTKIVIVNE